MCNTSMDDRLCTSRSEGDDGWESSGVDNKVININVVDEWYKYKMRKKMMMGISPSEYHERESSASRQGPGQLHAADTFNKDHCAYAAHLSGVLVTACQ